MTTRQKEALSLALLLCTALSLPASGQGDDRITLRGNVRRIGNDPFTELVISDEEGQDWRLDEKSTALLLPFEQQRVTVTASVRQKEMILANGKKLATRKILYDLVLEENLTSPK